MHTADRADRLPALGRVWLADHEVRRLHDALPFLEQAETNVLPEERGELTWPPQAETDELAELLAATPAGPRLARLLNRLSWPHLSTTALLCAVEATDRQQRWTNARQAGALAEAERRALLGGVDARVVPAEVSARLKIAPSTAEKRVGQAFELQHLHPGLWRAVQTGDLDQFKAIVIMTETSPLESLVAPETVADLEERLAQRGPQLTCGRLRALARREVARLVPTQIAEERHDAARARRNVWMEHEPDGMALLLARLPAPDAVAIMTLLDRLAGKNDRSADRTRPQRRADALSELMRAMLDSEATPLGKLPTAQSSRPTLLLTLERPSAPSSEPSEGPAAPWTYAASAEGSSGPVTKADGGVRSERSRPPNPTSPEPCAPVVPSVHLAGYGPITPGAALRAVPDATIALLVSDPLTGQRRHTQATDTEACVADVLAGRWPELPAFSGPSPPTGANDQTPATSGAVAGDHTHDKGQQAPDSLMTRAYDAGRIATKAERVADSWHVPCDRYRPVVALVRHVLLRDAHCTFATCRVPSWRCEIDHIVPFDPRRPAPAQTVATNLHAVCKAHHQVKTHGGWRVTRDPVTGITTWASPSGYTLANQPEYLDHA